MIEPLPLNFEIIESLAAAAFARSRLCATALREDVVPNLKPRERRGAERLISAIDRRHIFDEEPVIEKVSRLIASGATQTEHFIADECHIEGGATLTQTQHSAEAHELPDTVAQANEYLSSLIERCTLTPDPAADEGLASEIQLELGSLREGCRDHL